MRKLPTLIGITILLILVIFLPLPAAGNYTPLTKEEFEEWPYLPEYTVLNPFPSKGRNCTWFAHGRMMQIGYCKYVLDSMRYNANTWAERAERGAVVSDLAEPGTIAFWDSGLYYGSSLGHVAVVEAVYDDGSILISESSSSASAYNTRRIYPTDKIWPCAFIKVPPGADRSAMFIVGEYVATTVNNLNFRLEGANQFPLLLPKGTALKIKDHKSNGLYASQPGSINAYHYWWYAELKVEDETRYGWVAETYLQSMGFIEPEPVTGMPEQQDPAQESLPEEGEDEALIPEPQQQLGDIAGNGIIDVRDVTLVMQHILKIASLDPAQLIAADVNSDGAVDVRDATLIMRFILGYIVSFELD